MYLDPLKIVGFFSTMVKLSLPLNTICVHEALNKGIFVSMPQVTIFRF